MYNNPALKIGYLHLLLPALTMPATASSSESVSLPLVAQVDAEATTNVVFAAGFTVIPR